MSYLMWWLVGLALIAVPAHAHDWFSQTTDPVSHSGCCFGLGLNVDCMAVPKDIMDAGAITETQSGYHVELTLEQAKRFNKNSTLPVSDDVEWKRVQPGLSQGFAMCIYQNHVQCFFTASNT
jgi:hypothetical protein